MRIAFHFTIPPPPEPELDATVQEALWLQRRFGGSLHYLYPFGKFNRFVPSSLCGIRQLTQLRALDREVDVHHLFSGGLHSYPALHRLEKPVVYTLTTGLDRRAVSSSRLKWVGQLVTASEEDRDSLVQRGFERVEHVAPAIDVEAFKPAPLPFERDFYLLAGSAPWSRRQFRTKGFDMLLDAVERLPNLRLVLLWRGVLLEEIERRIDRRRLGNRVEVIEERVDVDRVLARVHAAVVLSESSRLVKAYPHSLLESLAAGKPIVVSSDIAIADYAEKTGCGLAVERFELGELVVTLENLMADYPRLQATAAGLDMGRFAKSRLLADYERLYRRLASQTDRS